MHFNLFSFSEDLSEEKSTEPVEIESPKSIESPESVESPDIPNIEITSPDGDVNDLQEIEL